MKRIALLATLAAFAISPTVASAAEPATHAPGTSANGIIAILIGLQFTPPIGSNKGSVVAP
jgi:hypothetical protein